MVSCAACGCSQTPKNKAVGITFHHFPKDDHKKKAWLKIVKKENWSPKKSSVLCSQHFSPDSFDRSSKLKVRLCPSAVPVIEVERLKCVRNFNEVTTKTIDVCVEERFVDLEPTRVLPEFDTPRKIRLKSRISHLEKMTGLMNQRIRKLQKLAWRQKRKIASLQEMTRELKKKNLMLLEHEQLLLDNFGSNKEIITRLFKKTQKKSESTASKKPH